MSPYGQCYNAYIHPHPKKWLILSYNSYSRINPFFWMGCTYKENLNYSCLLIDFKHYATIVMLGFLSAGVVDNVVLKKLLY